MRLLVKICGITRVEDAKAAVEAGAGALGFVFWPESPRFIDPFRARAIVQELPPFVATTGVFVNQGIREVNEIACLVPLCVAQLHGDEDPDFALATNRPVVKAVGSETAMARASIWPDRVMLLVDAHDAERRGGTGTVADWRAAAALARQRRVLLAGGLRPDNVAAAIAAVKPFGIDVSSGVESAPGVKDHALIKALFEAL